MVSSNIPAVSEFPVETALDGYRPILSPHAWHLTAYARCRSGSIKRSMPCLVEMRRLSATFPRPLSRAEIRQRSSTP